MSVRRMAMCGHGPCWARSQATAAPTNPHGAECKVPSAPFLKDLLRERAIVGECEGSRAQMLGPQPMCCRLGPQPQ